MASEEEIIAIDTKEDIEESTEDGTEDIIEIPIDRSPDRPEEPKSIKLEFQCDICLKVLSSKNNLKKHKLIHESAKYSCEICGKKFTYKWNMESHKIIHSGQKIFKCTSCPSSFFRLNFQLII